MPDSRDLSTGERIRMFRRRRGLTQEEAAGLCGVSLSLWRKWESGARAVGRFSQLVEIARALHVDDLRALTGQPLPVGPDGQPRHESMPDVRLALLRHPSLLPRGPVPDLGALKARTEEAWDIAQAASPWRYMRTGALLPDLIIDAERAVRSYEDAQLAEAVMVAETSTCWQGRSRSGSESTT